MSIRALGAAVAFASFALVGCTSTTTTANAEKAPAKTDCCSEGAKSGKDCCSDANAAAKTPGCCQDTAAQKK